MVGDGVFDALEDPAEEATGLTTCAAFGERGGCAGGGHALEDFDVEEGGGGGDTDDLAGAGADGSGGEGGGPGAVAHLVLGGAVVAGAGVGGLVDLGEVEGEIGGDVRVGGIDAAVEDGDANAFALGDVPGAVRGAAGDVVAVTSNLLDGPSLGRGVVGVVRGWLVAEDWGPMVTLKVFGARRRWRLCAETMRSWRTYSTSGWAASGAWRRRRLRWTGRPRCRSARCAGGDGLRQSGCGFGVAGDGGVAIEDEVAVWNDVVGVNLCGYRSGEAEETGEQASTQVCSYSGRLHSFLRFS